MTLQEQYAQLLANVQAMGPDAEKASAGNKAAGARLRKSIQALKAEAQELRKASLAAEKAS